MSWVDDVISEGEDVLKSSNKETMEEYIERTVERMSFEGVPKPKNGLIFYRQQMAVISENGCRIFPPQPNNEDIKNDVQKILGKLKEWKNMMLDPTSKAGKHYIENHNININNNSLNAQADSSSSSLAQIDLSITLEAIESSDLSEDQIKELKSLMLDLSAAKKKGPKVIAEKLKNALDIAKSSAGAAKAVLEFAVPIIQNIQ